MVNVPVSSCLLCYSRRLTFMPFMTQDNHNKELEPMLPVTAHDPYKKGQSQFGGPRQIQGYDNPHLKAYMLLVSHLSHFSNFPVADYATDLISVLDQSVRGRSFSRSF